MADNHYWCGSFLPKPDGLDANRWGGAPPSREEAEMAKWRNITYAAIAACTGLTVYDLFISPEEHHHHEKKKYSYLHIRNKAFPWGPCGLFEYDCNPDEEPVV